MESRQFKSLDSLSANWIREHSARTCLKLQTDARDEQLIKQQFNLIYSFGIVHLAEGITHLYYGFCRCMPEYIQALGRRHFDRKSRQEFETYRALHWRAYKRASNFEVQSGFHFDLTSWWT